MLYMTKEAKFEVMTIKRCYGASDYIKFFSLHSPSFNHSVLATSRILNYDVYRGSCCGSLRFSSTLRSIGKSDSVLLKP